MNEKGQDKYRGIGLLGILQIVFITMKLIPSTEVAAWSWGKVFIPTFIGIGIVFMVIVIASIITMSRKY